MAIQFMKATALTLARAHPIDSSRGRRNTARENKVPMAMVTMTNAAPSTTHP